MKRTDIQKLLDKELEVLNTLYDVVLEVPDAQGLAGQRAPVARITYMGSQETANLDASQQRVTQYMYMLNQFDRSSEI